ncbi:Beta-barrel assembly machine subunit BamA [Roseovarius halotolerans]|uniref:Outer membrane protein assembly factor BamA n=1 Tax=Roseovarius halotolerans TaxID=505353 RepID=A0A1X6YN25_9RHOB|nr:outer membrane protein assembly factor BamA [Roseovarius halotolerans]RKT34188.1 Beta-barrel assembly machine subunit BamA [Roseovarius halotolerans]SLN26226.1 Outer membrane protein assembly factor BamA precursor [Roseovarius halotolerans]
MGNEQHRCIRRADSSQSVLFVVRAFCLALLTAAIIGLPGDANAQSYRFNSVVVEGNQRIEADTILNYAGIARGETVSAGKLNDAYQSILGSGLFESVTLEPRGGQLYIQVAEYPTINRIAFEGNRRMKDEDMRRFIDSQPRQVFSPAKAERDAATLTEALSQNGRLAARVTPKVIRRSDNRVDLIFEIFEGSKVEVQRIGFVGNRAYSDRRLRRVIDSKQAGLLRAIIERDTFVEDRIQFDRQLLTDFYNSRGYVDFRVTGTNAELARGRDAYFVTFNIQEGQQFRFGEITTVSDRNDVDPEEYHNVLKVRSGSVYSPTEVENSISRMERLAIKNGVDFLRVEPRITRNDRDLTLDVEFALVRGPRVFVERIDIEGNTTTLDRVIRRQFDLVEGDPFNPRQIREAAERIRVLRYFSDVDVNAREGSRPDQVVVDVNVEETTTGSLSFGASYSTNSGVGVSVGFSERNFMGRGQKLTAQIAASETTAQYNINFVEPAFLSRNVEFGLDFSLIETDSDFSLYDTTIGVFRPSLTFPVSENGRFGVFYNATYNDMKDYTGNSGVLAAEVAQGETWASAIGYRYTYDTRRTGLDPNSGIMLSFGQEYAGLGGDSEYLKTSARVIAQTRVLNEEVTLRATLEGGALEFMGSNESRAVDRYTSQVMRGFEPNGIGPIEGTEHLGGNYFAVAKFEAEFPLGLPEEYGISGGAFYDVGAIWGVDSTNAAFPVRSKNFEPRHVVGLSLFWESPFGPLRLNWSTALKKEPGDLEQSFDLTVRTEF